MHIKRGELFVGRIRWAENENEMSDRPCRATESSSAHITYSYLDRSVPLVSRLNYVNFHPLPLPIKQHYYQVRVFDVRQERSVGADGEEDGMDASSATSVRDLPV